MYIGIALLLFVVAVLFMLFMGLYLYAALSFLHLLPHGWARAERVSWVRHVLAYVLCITLFGHALAPRADAAGVVGTVVGSCVIAAFLSACGIHIGNSSGQSLGDVLAPYIQDFMEDHANQDMYDITDVTASISSAYKSTIMIAADTWVKLCVFADWLVDKFGIVDNETGGVLTLAGEGIVYWEPYATDHDNWPSKSTINSTGFFVGKTDYGDMRVIARYSGLFVARGGNYLVFMSERSDNGFFFSRVNETGRGSWSANKNQSNGIYYTDGYFDMKSFSSDLPVYPSVQAAVADFVNISGSDGVSLDYSSSSISVPAELAQDVDYAGIAIPGIGELSTAAEVTAAIESAVATGTMADVQAQVISVTETMTDTLVIAEDIDSMGLPALGAALTSRFPFSIPWDIHRIFSVFNVPMKTPRFEVDFFAPIGELVGGWKGSTAIVLDFAEYEIIGELCRWTTTIGFCLFLAINTKRLVWTT